jgi:ATP-dependent Lhr-like helicase
VVLVDGRLTVYVERGGKTLLSWSDDATDLDLSATALVSAARQGALGRLRVEKADGDYVASTPLGHALERAGFLATPRGLRLRG